MKISKLKRHLMPDAKGLVLANFVAVAATEAPSHARCKTSCSCKLCLCCCNWSATSCQMQNILFLSTLSLLPQLPKEMPLYLENNTPWKDWYSGMLYPDAPWMHILRQSQNSFICFDAIANYCFLPFHFKGKNSIGRLGHQTISAAIRWLNSTTCAMNAYILGKSIFICFDDISNSSFFFVFIFRERIHSVGWVTKQLQPQSDG